MKNLAIVPARSGSKNLPDKNIRALCGKPLLAYSIEAALQSGMFDRVHVSTDSVKYAEIAENCGADVPFLRSAQNSSDAAPSWDAVAEVLEKYAKLGMNFENFMLLQPTSPLRTPEDITAAFACMSSKKANAVVSVCPTDHPPAWDHRLPADGSMSDFSQNDAERRRQDADVYYRINGAIYLVNTAYFLNGRNLYRSSCFAYVMEKKRSVDIDDELDFLFAETLLGTRHSAIGAIAGRNK